MSNDWGNLIPIAIILLVFFWGYFRLSKRKHSIQHRLTDDMLNWQEYWFKRLEKRIKQLEQKGQNNQSGGAT